jgi:hypothetical protein
MSLYGGIVAAVVAQLVAEVDELRKVIPLASLDQIDINVKNLPSAAVLITSSALTGGPQPMSSDVVLAQLEVLIVCRSLSGVQGVTSDDGAYELVDSVHAAIAGLDPTGAAIPIAYTGDEMIAADNGRVLWSVQFTVGIERTF